MNDFLGRIQYLAGDHATIDGHQSQTCLTIIENKGSRVQLIMNMLRPAILHATIAGDSQPGRDVSRGRSGPELPCCLSGHDCDPAGNKHR
jgi:hypothetical protein